MKLFRYLALLVLFGMVCSVVYGQPGDQEYEDVPNVTNAIAFRNALIVVKPGETIRNGTVVIRDGVIESAGSGVDIPYDARVIDASGLTIYPGFVDGFSFAGVAEPEKREEKVERPGDPPNERAGITPGRDIAEVFDYSDSLIDRLRRTGFCAAQAAPRGGMMPGKSGMVLLGGRDTNLQILPVGRNLVATFEGANDVYPATPMGIMATFRNRYRNAELRSRHVRQFRNHPRSLVRPGADEVLEALEPVVNGDESVLFRATDDLQMRRAALLAEELGFTLTLVDVHDGLAAIDLVKERRIPLFLSLDFPEDREEDDDDDSVSAESDDKIAPASDTVELPVLSSIEDYNRESMRTDDHTEVEGERLRRVALRDAARLRSYRIPGEVANRGVRFGFSTAGAKPKSIQANIRRAVENGLSRENALAALTIDGARLAGVDDILGSIEPGKIGSLVITQGDYFDDSARVKMVVVDGMVYDYSKDTGKKGKKEDAIETVASSDAALFEPPAVQLQRERSKSDDVLIRNGTVLTVTDGVIENGDVLIRDGKIAAVGTGLDAPGSARVVDATGKYVMPGIVDAHSHIAVSGPVNEWTNPVTSEVRIEDVVDPYDITLYRALAGGVTVSHVMHGSANVIGGQCETIKHRYGELNPETLKMDGAPRTIKFALGENPTRVHGRGFNVPPYTRMGVEQVFRETFTEAQRYREQWDEYRAAVKSGKTVKPPTYSLRLETMVDILDGDVIIQCHSYRADEILMLMRVLEDFGVERITFQHVNEGFKVAPELAEFGAMASVFSDWWAYKFEVYYSTAYNAAILSRNGVVTSINSDSPELNRHLYHEAAKSLRHGGLSDNECLEMITINPARQLGIEDRVGSLEVGKDGDVAIFSAHPLSVYAQPVMTIVDGVVRFDAEQDPDDMRLRIDPEEQIEPVYNGDDGHRDHCMDGVDSELMHTGE